MQSRCVLELGSEVYALEVETLHHRRFTGEGAEPHVHPSYHLILVSMGSCTLQVPGQPRVTVGEAGLIAIDPMVPHAFTGAPGRGVEHTCLIWRFRNRRGDYALLPLLRLAGLDPAAEPGSAVRRLSRFDARAFLQKQRAAEEAFTSGNPFLASMLAFELMFMGLGHFRPAQAPAAPDHQAAIVARIKGIIDRDLADPGLGVAGIARQIGLHPSHLNAVFRGREGMPLSQFIILQRVALMKALLAGSTCPVAEAGALAGFSRPSYCARVFRRLCGMSPSAWRDQAQVT